MAFGIDANRLALSPAEVLADANRRRALRETERKNRAGSGRGRSVPTIKVGTARPEYKQAQKDKKDAATKLAEDRIQRKQDIEDRKYEESQKEAEFERKKEMEELKASLKPEKKPSISDLKVQDGVNRIKSGEDLTYKDEFGGPKKVTNLKEAENFVRKELKLPPNQRDIQEALQERFVIPQEKYDTALLEAKKLQAGPFKQYRLGKIGEKPATPQRSGIFQTHPATGELYEYDPKDNSFHKVKQ